MNEIVKNKTKVAAEWFDNGRRIVVALTVFFTLIASGWTHYFGPGIKPAVQEFVGTTEISQRLEFVERYMPPPQVVDWIEGASQQIGACSHDRCRYLLTGLRTEYGVTCGRPTNAVPYLRTSQGRNVQIAFDNFEPVELGREPTSFTVPLSIPRFVHQGQHQFRVKVTYLSCPGVIGPADRWTPWFPLSVVDREDT